MNQMRQQVTKYRQQYEDQSKSLIQATASINFWKEKSETLKKENEELTAKISMLT